MTKLRLLARFRYAMGWTAVHPTTRRVRMEWRNCTRCLGGGWFRGNEKRPLCSWCRALKRRLGQD